MSKTSEKDFVLPSSPADLEKISSAVQEMVDSLTRQASEKDLFNSIRERLEEEFEMPKSLSGRLAKTKFKQDFDEQAAKSDVFALVYEAVAKE